MRRILNHGSRAECRDGELLLRNHKLQMYDNPAIEQDDSLRTRVRQTSQAGVANAIAYQQQKQFAQLH